MLDTLGMFDAALGLPEQVRDAAAAAATVDGLPSADGLTSVLIMGMGGSGIGGDVTAAVAGPTSCLPIMVSKHYECPGFVGPGTLVVAISFSGNTEETLAALGGAVEAGAKVVVMASGGKLAALAKDIEAPLVPVDGSIPMPRAGIGAVSVPTLVLLERMGLLDGATGWIDAAVDQLQRRRDQLTAADNAARTLARHLGRTLPIVYGGGAVGETAAWRWKGQFNENPKIASFANRIPELTHNEICGWGQHGDVTRQVFSLLLLRHSFEDPQVARRFALVEEISEEVLAGVHSVHAEGEGRLAQLMDLVLFGDMVTLYQCEAEGVDPGPVPILDGIKRTLAAPA
jgi:glucose/mannose-6-phosphate isomerase